MVFAFGVRDKLCVGVLRLELVVPEDGGHEEGAVQGWVAVHGPRDERHLLRSKPPDVQ